ncbi:hypothetical protein CEXT_176511 [Caerostris extrusa]|uniref:Uncharacterized protein n=1 Tax=Caerostris extrusa TaxID=172846 RepID=A0AAV4UAE5_CAEEX|nr:hypothetical protein CEXT_176511 [Caerostris extrusa]
MEDLNNSNTKDQNDNDAETTILPHIYVLDDYDVLPANSNNQHNEYIFVADNGDIGGNILPTNLLRSSADLNNQPVYIIDGNIANYAARFQQDTATVDDLPQQKTTEFKEPLHEIFKVLDHQETLI